MLLLRSIQLKNFLSHSNTKLEFEDSERILIDGKSGAGKSAIIDALVWVLYNTGRVQNRSLIKRGQKEANVIVTLVNETNEKTVYYLVSRTITSGGKHELEVLESDSENVAKLVPIAVSGTKNIQSYLEKEILKCSYPLFINSVCYPQENPDNFVRQTPAKRKDLLLELVGSQNYEEYTVRIREVISEAESQIATGNGKLEQLETELNRTEELAKPLVSLETTLKTLVEENEKIDQELIVLQQRQTEINLVTERIRNTEESINTVRAQVASLDTRIDGLSLKIRDLRTLDEVAIKERLSRREQVLTELRTLETRIKELYEWKDTLTMLMMTKPPQVAFEARITELSRQQKVLTSREISLETCPHCNKDHVCSLLAGEIKHQLSAIEAQMLIVKEEERAHREALAAYEAKITAHTTKRPEVDTETLLRLQAEAKELEKYVEEGVRLQLKERSIKEWSFDIDNLNIEKKGLLEKQKELSLIKASFEKQLSTLSSVGGEKSILLQKSDQLRSQIGETKERIGVAKAAQARIGVIVNLMLANQTSAQKFKEDLEALKLLRDAFGANGIKAIVIDYLLPYLEQRINEVLEPLSDFRIRFSTQKSNVSGDSTIEGLFITVINSQGEELDFESYSGGQKVKILFAITEGLAQMQKIGFRILDEAVIGLDDESGDQFAEAILAFKERFSQLICISHVQQIKDLFESKIQVTYLNGTSSVDK